MSVIPEAHVRRLARSLQDAVAVLPPNAKKAMYAASKKNLIRRGTWDGCAWNAAGIEVNANISSEIAAANVFNVEARLVERFISYWDSLDGTDRECTDKLVEALFEVGLKTPPMVYTALQGGRDESKFLDEFDTYLESLATLDNRFVDETGEDVLSYNSMLELLNGKREADTPANV